MAKKAIIKSEGPTTEYVPCNLCGSRKYSVVFSGIKQEGEGIDLSEKYSASSNEIGNDQVVKCDNCGLMFVNPRLKANAIVEGYSDAVDETYVSQMQGRLATFRDGVKKIDAYCPEKGKILDVGSAGGIFLKAAKDDGWDTYGVEPSRWLVKWGNKKFGLKMKAGTIHDVSYPTSFFDVVTMWDVLEHVPDPKADLNKIGKILKKDGLLVVNYPNIASRMARLAGSKWWFLLSVHLTYFTPETIRKMLETTGFEVVSEKRHWQKLSLGYLAYRFNPYAPWLSRALTWVFNTLGIQDKQLKYYASQSMVVARKK